MPPSASDAPSQPAAFFRVSARIQQDQAGGSSIFAGPGTEQPQLSSLKCAVPVQYEPGWEVEELLIRQGLTSLRWTGDDNGSEAVWLYLESGHFSPLLTNLQLMAAPQQGAPLLAPLKVDLTDPNLQPGDDAPEWAYDAAQDTFPRWMRARAVTIHWVGLHLERQHALADGWRDAWRMCVMPAVLPYL